MKDLKEVMQALVLGKKLTKLSWNNKSAHFYLNKDSELIHEIDNFLQFANDNFIYYFSNYPDIVEYIPWFKIGDEFSFKNENDITYKILYIDDDCFFAKSISDLKKGFVSLYKQEYIARRNLIIIKNQNYYK